MRDSSELPFSLTNTFDIIKHLKTICLENLDLSDNGIVDYEPGSLFSFDRPECLRHPHSKETAIQLKYLDYSFNAVNYNMKKSVTSNMSLLSADASYVFLPTSLEKLDISYTVLNTVPAVWFSSQIRGKGTWKFNNSLLRETEFIDKVKGDIKTVIEEYESDPSMDIETEDKQFNISYQLLWDMIKMKVLGSAISFSSFQKKEGNKKEKELLYKISLLDEKLLENNLPSVYQEREGIELELKILREKNVKGIITRAKARWQVEGEKGSNYFCNLEKKHYTEKIIPKLILEDETEITDPSTIRNEQKQLYKKLYTSCKPLLLKTHRDTFLQHDNPFITKPNEEEVGSCEGPLTMQECLSSLKLMKNSKSPGIDGFTVEFYKFFWNDIKIPLFTTHKMADQVIKEKQQQFNIVSYIKNTPKHSAKRDQSSSSPDNSSPSMQQVEKLARLVNLDTSLSDSSLPNSDSTENIMSSVEKETVFKLSDVVCATLKNQEFMDSIIPLITEKVIETVKPKIVR
ncbi:unnamed protein product [Mytilus edulis]|uniref:Uncharacterized protein n=1 Tax=Mytilus edulis TaxID=6550 RepID=A0A8S3PYY3_MYTED|nr:unnamed protein product [Mytilus edulis]